ncbi:MAG: SOS response-associated peptidase [Polyangiales bacterium]
MCGRFSLGIDPESVMDDLAWVSPPSEAVVSAHPEAWRPRFNVAPGQPALVIGRRDDRPPTFAWMIFGLVPHWAKPGSSALSRPAVNARVETVAERATFRDPFRRRRCLVPVDGWYEWSGEGDARQAHWVHDPSGALLTLGAVWDRWRDPTSGASRFGFAILTTPSRGVVAALHPRMPFVVDASQRDAWLSAHPFEGSFEPELGPFPASDRRAGARRHVRPPDGGRTLELQARPVGRRVNDVHHDDPSCREEAS